MNLASARRQSFGARYEDSSKDASLAKAIQQGRLKMAPHPEWSLPRDPSWLENPLNDDNWQFQYHSLRWLDPLRRVALHGDDEAKQTWERYVKSWIAANPSTSSPTRWAWIDMGDALRTYVLVFGASMYEYPPTWLVATLVEHMLWLADESHLGHGNHALHQHQALFVVASVMERPDLAELAVDRLQRLFEAAYDNQGINEEGSISYQEANFRWWNEAILRLELEGISRPEWSKPLELVPETLAHATQPNGQYVRIGDMDSGRPDKIDSPWTNYASSEGATGLAPEDLIKVYKKGYIFGRSGWGETQREFADETFFSMTFGEQRKIHGHADGGSITYFAKGHPWLIETGKFQYGRHPIRTYVVNRSGHNSIEIRDKKYDRNSKVTLFRKHETGRFFEAVVRDTGYPGVLIYRRTIYSKRGEYLFVVDTVSSEDEVTAEQRWHIDQNTQVKLHDDTAHLDNGNQTNTISWLDDRSLLKTAKGETKPYNGWTSLAWKRSTSTTVISAEQSGTQLHFRTVIGASVDLPNPVQQGRVVAKGYREYAVNGKVGIEYLLIGKNLVLVSDKPFESSTISDHIESQKNDTNSETAAEQISLPELTPSSFPQLIPGSADISTRRIAFDECVDAVRNLGVPKANLLGLSALTVDIAGEDFKLPDILQDYSTKRAPIISWSKENKVTHRNGDVKSYASRRAAAEEFQFAGVQSYRFGNLTASALSIPGSTSTLHVSFHGALDRGIYTLPRFERAQLLSSVDAHHVIFSDPTLDLSGNMTLGWFLGTRNLDMHEEVANFVSERMQAIGADNVILSGSSGGGFAALQVGAFLPGCTVLAFNPQTDVMSYHSRFARKAVRVAFGNADLDSEEIRMRLNVAHRYNSRNSSGRIIFIQNQGDEHHSTLHREPFIERVKGLDGLKIETIFESWGTGHKSPRNEVYMKHLLNCGLTEETKKQDL